jgi:hypothetical protein
MEGEIRPITDGDVFCEDDNSFVGSYENIEKESIPLELSVYYKGKLFIYTLARKEQYENDAGNEETTGHGVLEADGRTQGS